MAAITIEGFEAQFPITLAKKGWSSSQALSYVAGRFGGSAVVSSASGLDYAPPTPVTTLYTGAGIYLPNITAGYPLFNLFDASGTTQCSVKSTSAGALQILRSTTVLATSASSLIAASAWNFIEVKFVLHPTAGIFDVRLNGNPLLNFTGNTRNSGTDTTVGKVRYVEVSSARMDDFYFHDDTGVVHNSYRGDFKVETLVPNGNGTYSQLTGSDGNSVDNYALVDEMPGSTSDYAGSSTVGQRDTYALSNLVTASGAVLDVQVDAMVAKTDPGPATMALVERMGSGTERETTATALPGSAAWITSGPRPLDPENAPWTTASVNALEAGVEVG